MSQEYKSEPPKKTREQIEQEIERTRSALSNDIHALGEKLSPEHIKENAKEVIREAKSAAAESIREARSAATDSLRDVKDAAVGSLREAKDKTFETVSDTVHVIGRSAQRATSVTGEFVGAHAVPLALVGLGVGWLMLSMNHQRRRESDRYLASRYDRDYDRAPRGSFADSEWDRYDDSYGDSYSRRQMSTIADEARQRAGNFAHEAQRRAGSIAHRAAEGLDETRSQVRETVQAARSRVDGTLSDLREQASNLRQHAAEIGGDLRGQAADLGHQAYDQIQRVQERTVDFAEQNPLAVGALALVAGVGVGMLLPHTRREDRLLGETRDRLIGDAQRTASRLGETVKSSASELRGALMEHQHH